MIMQALQGDSTLQGGKYRIIKTLGQGGFGITYLAENTLLESKVAIKEFFFKECCERDANTSHVTVPTFANRDTVERFKLKFVKEARTIFKLNHPNIVHILDVFEENDTAYYVMEYIEGESLSDMVTRRGAIPEAEAIGYVKEAAKALMYIHGKNINHLDIKPGNLMRRKENGRIIVIDFGVAKQYDLVTSRGTTTTPVGITCGYSPAEQYRKNGVQTFSPQSDVYALAATLFKLLTGNTPPEAMEIMDDGLPVAELLAKNISQPTISAIAMAMKGKSERTQSVALFVESLPEVTSVFTKNNDWQNETETVRKPVDDSEVAVREEVECEVNTSSIPPVPPTSVQPIPPVPPTFVQPTPPTFQETTPLEEADTTGKKKNNTLILVIVLIVLTVLATGGALFLWYLIDSNRDYGYDGIEAVDYPDYGESIAIDSAKAIEEVGYEKTEALEENNEGDIYDYSVGYDDSVAHSYDEYDSVAYY